MDDKWYLSLMIFLITDNSPEMLSLINADNFDEAFKELLKQVANTDAIKIKTLIISKMEEHKETLRMLNKATKRVTKS